MRKKILGLVMLGTLLGGASSCASTNEKPSSLEIRIANRSGQDFDQVEVTFPSERVDYGALKNGSVTDYRNVKTAYRYALVEVDLNGRSLSFQPQDYMGEEPLEPGRYTYEVRIADSGEDLRIELIKE